MRINTLRGLALFNAKQKRPLVINYIGQDKRNFIKCDAPGAHIAKINNLSAEYCNARCDPAVRSQTTRKA